jgi:REP element-mobilizing transposase RayT
MGRPYPQIIMPKFDPKIHHRKSIRLKGFDYSSAGAYYVTIVTWHRDCLFGEVVQPKFPTEAYVNLSAPGKIADECWRAIPDHFPSVELGAYMVMPNHVHGIIVINGLSVGATQWVAPTSHKIRPNGPKRGSLGAIIGSYKMAVTRRIQHELNFKSVWQRNYHDHIIRDETDLQNKTDYIEANPSLWDEDDVNPRNAH